MTDGDALVLIGYARSDVDDQELALQMEALERAGAERVYTDTASRAPMKRAGLGECLRDLKTRDILIVWRLGRLARSIRQLAEISEFLENHGIGLRSLVEDIDTTRPEGWLIFHTMRAIGQFERNLVDDRIRGGLKDARARGVRVGRARIATEERIEKAKDLIRGGMSVQNAARAVGLAKSTLYRDLPGGAAAIGPEDDVDIPVM